MDKTEIKTWGLFFVGNFVLKSEKKLNPTALFQQNKCITEKQLSILRLNNKSVMNCSAQ